MYHDKSPFEISLCWWCCIALLKIVFFSAEVTAACSQMLASNLQPCMQQSYEGDRSMCVQEVIFVSKLMYLVLFLFFEVVGVKAPDVCQSVVEKCAGLRTIANHIQLATALTVSIQLLNWKCILCFSLKFV